MQGGGDFFAGPSCQVRRSWQVGIVGTMSTSSLNPTRRELRHPTGGYTVLSGQKSEKFNSSKVPGFKSWSCGRLVLSCVSFDAVSAGGETRLRPRGPSCQVRRSWQVGIVATVLPGVRLRHLEVVIIGRSPTGFGMMPACPPAAASVLYTATIFFNRAGARARRKITAEMRWMQRGFRCAKTGFFHRPGRADIGKVQEFQSSRVQKLELRKAGYELRFI